MRKKLTGDDKAGIYITVIAHLTVIIILLVCRIGATFKKGESFLMDFSQQEAVERQLAEEKKAMEDEAFGEEISRRVEELISGSSGESFRNVATDRSALKDDRGTDAKALYEDAERLAKDLRNGVDIPESDDDYVAVPAASESKKKDNKDAEYGGPSVVSYNLAGRKASRLSIPAYRCYGGGMVVVLITVNNAGEVINAKVQDAGSSDDKCLRDYAIRAARLSRFSSDPKAPARQSGDIVYQFIAQ